MSSKAPKNIPKTGLAPRMREWMKAQKRPFTKRDVYLGLGIDDIALRATLRNAVPDFERRGEIILQPPDKRNRRENLKRYRYNPAWKGGKDGVLKARIFKAMYVSGTFAVRDLVRLCHPPEETEITRSWCGKLVRRLRSEGHLCIVGRRQCAHGAGAESLYHVANRDKFRLEVMR